MTLQVTGSQQNFQKSAIQIFKLANEDSPFEDCSAVTLVTR